MPNIIKARFKLRSGTTADWLAHDEVLANAEVGEEVTPTGERLRKVGDGTSKWSELPYRVNDPVDRATAPTDGQTLVYNASTGLLEWQDAGKTYQAGTNITIDNPTSATPTINSNAGLQIDDRVDTYANLPSPPTEGTGATYLVTDGGSYADNLLYVWDGSSWPAEGDGIQLGSPTDRVLTSYMNAVLADSPVAYWPLDDAGTAADISGNGHPAALSGALWARSAGIVKGSPYAVQFGGGTAESQNCVRSAFPLSMEAWFVAAGVNGTIVSTNNDPTRYRGVTVGYNNNAIELLCGSGGGSSSADRISWSAIGALSLGSVYHVVAVFSSFTTLDAVYLNGVAQTLPSASGSASSISFAGSGSGVGIRGNSLSTGTLVAHAAIYDTQLSAARVLAHYDAGKGGP